MEREHPEVFVGACLNDIARDSENIEASDGASQQKVEIVHEKDLGR
jgi:hypothetical protein